MRKIWTSSDTTIVLFIVQCLEGGEANDNSITQVSLKIPFEKIDKKLRTRRPEIPKEHYTIAKRSEVRRCLQET